MIGYLLVANLLATNPHLPVVYSLDASMCRVENPWAVGAHASDDRWRSSSFLWFSGNWRPSHLEVTPVNTRPTPDTLLDTAREHLGTPYVWGGTGRSGYDCSGFVNAVYARHGYDLPRVSRDQYRVGMKVSRWDLKAGDLLFFKFSNDKKISHVAMYVGEDEFIHAARGKGRVTFDRLTSNYYSKGFAGARRFISLPPGKFSNSWGGALPNRLFDGSEVTDSLVLPELDPVLLELGLSESGDVPREHDPDDRPLQLSSGFIKGAVTNVGPRLVHTDATTLGVQLGAGQMNRVSTLVMAPEFTYFGHDNALSISLGAPIQIPLTGHDSAGKLFEEGWDRPSDYTRILRSLQFGQKESNLYLELSRTASGSLGHGQVMRYFTPNVSSPYLPRYALNPDALSASFDAYAGFGGFEIFVDDVLDPHVMGTLLFGRPAVLAGSDETLLKRISVGLTYAVDRDAPLEKLDSGSYSTRALHVFGIDTEIKYYKSDLLDIKSYVDLSGLAYEGNGGVGGALGTLIRANLSERRHHVLRFRVEGRLSSATFIPSYFDTSYRLSRTRVPVVREDSESPLTKLGLLEELKGTANRWGVYGELVYHFKRKASVVLSYEEGDSAGSLPSSERYVGRNLMALVQVKDFYFPRSTKAVSFYLAYHLRNFKWPLTKVPDANQYLFASASMHLSRWVEINGSLRKSLNADSDVASMDAMLGVAARYEF